MYRLFGSTLVPAESFSCCHHVGLHLRVPEGDLLASGIGAGSAGMQWSDRGQASRLHCSRERWRREQASSNNLILRTASSQNFLFTVFI